MNKIHRKKLNTKMSYNMFFSAFIKLHSHFHFFLFCSTFLSLSFRGKLLVWKDMHTITYNHSLIHPSTHSLARSLTTHHCLNMVFAVVVVLVVVCFFHLPEKKKFIRNEHSQNNGENERTKERARAKKKEIQLQMHPRFWYELSTHRDSYH